MEIRVIKRVCIVIMFGVLLGMRLQRAKTPPRTFVFYMVLYFALSLGIVILVEL